jgi:hypothetical protein
MKKAQRIKHRDGIGAADKLIKNTKSGKAAFIQNHTLCFMLYALLLPLTSHPIHSKTCNELTERY